MPNVLRRRRRRQRSFELSRCSPRPRNESWVNKAPIFNITKRLDPTFDPKEFKFATFATMLKSLEGRLIKTRKGEFDQQARVLTSRCP